MALLEQVGHPILEAERSENRSTSRSQCDGFADASVAMVGQENLEHAWASGR